MKPILVDSSVLLDVFTNDPEWASWSVDALVSWSASYEPSVNDVVVAEVSVGFSRIEDLREALGGVGAQHIPMPLEALFLAGKAFVAYRRNPAPYPRPRPDQNKRSGESLRVIRRP